MEYNVSYCLCALIVMLLSYGMLFSEKDMRRKNSRLFLWILLSETASTVFSAWSGVMNSDPARYSLGIRTFASGGDLIAHGMVCLTCAWYLVNYLGFSHKWTWEKEVLFALPEIFLVVVPILLSPLRQYVYKFKNGLIYVTCMPGKFFVDLAGYLYLGVIVYMMLRCHRQLSREQNKALVLLVVMATVCAIIEQVILPTQRISPFFESVAIFLFLMSVDNQNWVYNKLTHTYDRLTFQRYVENWFRNDTEFDILIVSMDRKTYFKNLSMEAEDYQRLMLSLGNFFKGMKGHPDVFYCERGIFLIPVFRDSGFNARELITEIEDRFKKPWDAGDPENRRQIYLPIRLIYGQIPETVNSLQNLFRLIDVPYDAESKDPLLVDTAAQVSLFVNEVKTMEERREEKGEAKTTTELPRELAVMLDSFSSNIADLTPMERRIVLYYLDGYEIAGIPEAAGISINTVRKHNKNIYRKLQIGSKEELMMYLDVLDRCGRLDPIEKMLREGADTTDTAETNNESAAGKPDGSQNEPKQKNGSSVTSHV